MKPLRCNLAVLALWSVLAILAGCTHKKPAQAAPPQPPPVATAPEASPTPTPAAQQAEPTPTPQSAQAASPDQANAQTTQTDKAQKPKKPSPRKTAASSGPDNVARNNPPRKVIPADKTEPTPQPGQISPAPADGAHPQGSTEQLLKAAEANLNGINRQLSKEEEAKRSQAREFINQSRKATSENDSARAYNLAVKARLLSDELVQQR